MVATSLLLVSLFSLAAANPAARNMVIHELREEVPVGFVQGAAAAPDSVLNLRIALVQNNMPGLEKALYDVSTPRSALYGQHLSKEEAEAFVRPTTETTEKVTEWLSSNGFTATTISPAGDWLAVSMPVSQANSMLDADFTVFTHEETGQQAVRTLAYSIPAALKGHVDLVHPTITFPNPHAGLPVFTSPLKAVTVRKPEAKDSPEAVPASCDTTITPSCLQSLYGITTTPATQSSNGLAVSGFFDQFANLDDLSLFLETLRPDLSSTTFSVQTLDGGTNSQNPNQAGVKASQDIQYTVGVASGVPTTFYSVGENSQDGNLEGYLDLVNFVLGDENVPNVLTSSYGQDEQTISTRLAQHLCNAYAALGARGTSVIFASGDGGVAGFTGSQTTSCTTFLPTFPSNCPFITSVGATTGITETGSGFSSGGFSNVFPIAQYQSAAVSEYLAALGSTNRGVFNSSGRAFPDVSAQGENFEIIVGGQTITVSSTGCASSTFASVVALLNDRLLARDKSPLGFLNPFLYSQAGAAALNDVTTGNNPGCNTDGFPATTGWDPVSGLGTPNFGLLLSAVGL